MEVFKKYFPDVENWEQEEVSVICPYHNDTRPSASINTSKSLFHCWVCDIGYNEEQFLSRLNNIPVKDALKLINEYNYSDNWNVENGRLWSNEEYLRILRTMGFTDEVIEECKLGISKYDEKDYLGIPVFYNGILVDVRKYNFLKYKGVPKMQSNENARTGWVIPYDKFLDTEELCYFFEGEKDMLIARSQGLNAYTLTGGAGAKPNEYTLNAFKDKDIIICYDNDKPGKDGMYNLYKHIKDSAKTVRYIDIGQFVDNEKEDFYDYITKYNGDVFDFYMASIEEFKEKEDVKKFITIRDALKDNIIKKQITSEVLVDSDYSNYYTIPTIVECTKIFDTKDATMEVGEKLTWYLSTSNINQILELIEVDAKDQDIDKKFKQFLGIPVGEKGIKIVKRENNIVYRCSVVDKDMDGNNIPLDIYSFEKLDIGGQYEIDYKIFPHPTKHQKAVGISINNKKLNDNNSYKLDKEKLELFRRDGSIEERLNYLYQSAKHHIAKHLNYNLWLFCDLVFNSILDFNFDGNIRGALDVFILGDTQVGKSETSSKLVELYNFGHFLSLKTSTTVGLIGGSRKSDSGSYRNTIGAIPRQHKKLAVLEEFSGARPDFIKTMTDIRSSNEVRISRVGEELVAPCKLRMITISNPRNDENGNPRFLSTFPNGVMPLMELINSAEDVSRYDGFILVPKVEKRFNPFENKLQGTPIPKDAYESKINWVATRQIDNIKFEEGVESYIWEKAQELNELFECNFPLFATTTDKKLARFCVALATLIVNVDDTYENIVVTKDIVDYMVSFLKQNYDNDVFRLKEYADEYKSYNDANEEDIKNLQELYSRNATLFNYLRSVSRTSRNNLASISGLEMSKFATVFNRLVSDKFIRVVSDMVYPTNKFTKAYNKIDRTFVVDTGSMVK